MLRLQKKINDLRAVPGPVAIPSLESKNKKLFYGADRKAPLFMIELYFFPFF